MRLLTALAAFAVTAGATPCAAQVQADMPPIQGQFIKIVEDARLEYKNGANDMAKGAARPKRARSICNLIRSKRVERWIGWVVVLSTNNDGRGILSIRVAPDIHLQTWNNSLSDIIDKTLIDPHSKVFETAASMKKGDFVKFSGSFVSGEADCIGEQSVTLSGSINDPEFTFRFSELVKNY